MSSQEPWFDYPYLQYNAYQLQDIGGDTPHAAVDIQTPFHTQITAPDSGTVKIADYQAWGGEVFIQPDKGGPEEYWYHFDENEVHVGEHVNSGDFIGLSGGENPGYPGAEHPADPMWSSGPHTHFGYFTNWWNIPGKGTRPFGPDPRPLIDALKSNAPTPTLDSGRYDLSSVFNLHNPEDPISSWISSNVSPYIVRGSFMLLGAGLLLSGVLVLSGTFTSLPQFTTVQEA